MYSVAMWLVCQIVDVITPALELPEWTLKLVVVFGLLGLPLIILMSWLFEITPDGLIIEGSDDTSHDQSQPSGPIAEGDHFPTPGFCRAAILATTD